jgi:hypothetical protein
VARLACSSVTELRCASSFSLNVTDPGSAEERRTGKERTWADVTRVVRSGTESS